MTKSRKILVVDDDDMVRMVLVAMFEQLGHIPFGASNGQEGLEIFSRENPDIVFTDLQMPEMNGLTFISRIRDKNPEMPIIVISGAGTVNEAIDAIRMGAWDYITKPVRLPDLEIVLQQSGERMRLLAENRSYQEYLEDLVMERTLELRDSEARFRTLFESANDGIILIRDDRIISCNRKTLDLFGCVEEEVIGNTLLNLSPPGQPGGIRSEHLLGEKTALALSGEPQSYEWRHVRKNGSTFDTEISLNRLKLQDVFHLQAIMRDITERKKAEKAHLDNTRLKRELEIAREIQQSLLPACPPQMGSLLVSCRCLPAASVGGDYYDFFTPIAGILDIVIADVAGHSIGSALLMVEARSTLHARAGAGYSPGDLLTAVNTLLYKDLSRAELQMSMFYARLDMHTHAMSYANAGHIRPLLLRNRSREFIELDTEGMLMGINGEVDIQELTVAIEPGDLILFHTDGVIDAENSSGEFFGAERLRQTLLELRELAPEQIASQLLIRLSAFAGDNALTDDITLVVVKDTPDR